MCHAREAAQARREGGVGVGKYSGPRDDWGPPSFRNIKYTRICHFKRKKIPQKGPAKMFGGPVKMFPWPLLWLSTGLQQTTNNRHNFVSEAQPAVRSTKNGLLGVK